MKIICLSEKLDDVLQNTKLDENPKNRLFSEFEKPVNLKKIIDSKKIKQTSINDVINKSIESIIENIAMHIINTESSFQSSKNAKELVTSIENIFKDSNLGTFEYMQKAGKNILRIEHLSGTNGSKFYKLFFQKVFEIYLKNYSYHIISNESHVSIIFR